MQIQGYNIDDMALLQPRDQVHIDTKGISAKRVYLALYNTWATDVAPLIYRPFPQFPTCLLEDITCDQEQEIGELCLVTLKYSEQWSNQPAATPTPQPEYGINAGASIQPITLHPNFVGGASAWDANAPWSQFWDASKKDWQSDGTGKYLSTVPTYLIGWTQYPAAKATIWTKIYYPSYPGLPLPQGLISDPGFGFGPSGSFLVATCDLQKENAFWCMTTHYEYFPLGVPTQIFQRG